LLASHFLCIAGAANVRTWAPMCVAKGDLPPDLCCSSHRRTLHMHKSDAGNLVFFSQILCKDESAQMDGILGSAMQQGPERFRDPVRPSRRCCATTELEVRTYSLHDMLSWEPISGNWKPVVLICRLSVPRKITRWRLMRQETLLTLVEH
jgi:hypothetical protein